MSQCYPALIGVNTPVGQFEISDRFTPLPGYGGDVLQFYETDTEWYAIHRVYLLNRNEHRDKRLRSTNVHDRVITKGCINVANEVYLKLQNCCLTESLTIDKE